MMQVTLEGVAMRALSLLMAFVLAGCASHLPSAATPAPAVTPPADNIEAQRAAQARNLNLKVVNKDGQQVYCRSNLMTGSHIQRDMTCYTADQLDQIQARTERDLDRLNSHPTQGPGSPSH
jgi:hypothetical protein